MAVEGKLALNPPNRSNVMSIRSPQRLCSTASSAAVMLWLPLMLVAGCATDPRTTPTLHQRLGGAARITAVVDRTIERAATDVRTRRSFDGIKLAALKLSLVEQICALTGGGCRYEGATMAAAHKDSRILDSEFDALVTILREELDRRSADAAAKNELLRLLAPMKRDIVAGRRDAP